MATDTDFKVKHGLFVTEDIELGHATDTTIARSSAGVITLEGVVVPTISSTNTLTNKTYGPLSSGYVVVGASNDTAAITSNGAHNLHLSTNSNTNSGSIYITDGVNGDIVVTPNGTGDVVLDGLNWPQADGSANQVLKTDGSAQLSWTDVASLTGAVTTIGTGSANAKLTSSGSHDLVLTTNTNASFTEPYMQLNDSDAGHIYIVPGDDANSKVSLGRDSTSKVQINGQYYLPQAVTGTNDYVLTAQTDGTTAWAAVSGGASDLDGLSDAKSGGTDFTDSLLIGHQTHGTLDNALYNTGVGIAALDALTSGDSNVAVGRRALGGLNTGVENTFVGRNAGYALTSGNRNIGIGHKAADGFDTESDNIAIGDDALGGSIAGGEKNIGIGNGAGANVTSGDENVLVGHMAGGYLSTGGYNVAIGAFALENADVGAHNIAIGYEALECGATNSDVDDNVAIGTAALKAAIDGASGNVAIGKYALTVATKDDNVAVGLNAANSITTGERNVMIGTEAGHALADDNNSVIIGYQAGDNLTAGNGNVIIGCYTDAPSATDDGQLVIGTSSAVNDPYYWILGDSTGAITFNHKADVVAVSGNTTLTLAQTGSYIYWTAGTLTLPASGTPGTQYTIFNNTGGSATVALNGSNCSIVSGWASNAAVADHEGTSYICVTANNWIQVG